MIPKKIRLYRRIKNKIRSIRIKNSPFYIKYPVNKKFLFLTNYRILISEKHKFAYVRIPKCANSTVAATLGIMEGDLSHEYFNSLSDSEKRDKVEKEFKINLFKKPSELSKTYLTKLDKDFYKFTVVRNPYSRVMSAYNDVFINRKQYAKYGFTTRPTFMEFLLFLENGGLYYDHHWYPMSDYFPFKTSFLDNIVKMENFEDEFIEVLKQVFLKEDPIIYNFRLHKTNVSNDFKKVNMNNDEIYKVNKIYYNDFMNFNYKMY